MKGRKEEAYKKSNSWRAGKAEDRRQNYLIWVVLGLKSTLGQQRLEIGSKAKENDFPSTFF